MNSLRVLTVLSLLALAIVSNSAKSKSVEVNKFGVPNPPADIGLKDLSAFTAAGVKKIPLKTLHVPVQEADFIPENVNSVEGFLPLIWPRQVLDKVDRRSRLLNREREALLSPIKAFSGMRIGRIGIGSPSQEFNVLMSFSSSQFWVYSSTYLLKNISSSEPMNKNVYNSDASETAIRSENEIEFTEYVIISHNVTQTKAKGNIVSETIHVGETSVPNVLFGAINEINRAFYETEFKLYPTDGQMGLMLSNETGSGRYKIPSPIFGLVANAKKPVITISQKPAKYEWQEPYMDGSLTIGSENNEECTSYSPSIAYTTNKVPFIEGQPIVHVKSLKLSNGFDFSIEPRQAVIVEHIPGILVHQEEADRIGRKLAPFGARKIKPGFYMIPCNSRGKLPSLRFELAAVNNNDASIVLDFNEYIINYRKDVCLLAVMGNFLAQFSEDLGRTIFIGNSMLQGKCMSLNVVDQTVKFGNSSV